MLNGKQFILCCVLSLSLSPVGAQEVCGLSDAQFENLLVNGFEDPNATFSQDALPLAKQQVATPLPLRPLRIAVVP
jgi:hypothetical protein